MHFNYDRRAVNMKMRTIKLPFTVTLLLLGGIGSSVAGTTVTGTVRDSSGRPLPHAYVEAVPVLKQSGPGTVGNFGNPWVATNSSGSFSLTLAPGRYRIRAKDEAEGYPDPSFWLGRDPKARFPEIAVGTTEITGVAVVLGTRGGILSGQIRDALTHMPVPGAKIRIEDPQNSDAYVEVFANREGQFQYTVPSKPLLISATAPGYKSIEVVAAVEQTLSPGEYRKIDLELNRE
jgi:hypothetical protein